MRNTFEGREDIHLYERLSAEMPGFLNWAVEGYRRLHARGSFVLPTSSLGTAVAFGALSSPVKEFVEDRCVIGAIHSVPKQQLFYAWNDYCSKTNNQLGSIETFARDPRAAGYQLGETRPTVNGKRQRLYTRIGLVDVAGTSASIDPKIVRLPRTS